MNLLERFIAIPAFAGLGAFVVMIIYSLNERSIFVDDWLTHYGFELIDVLYIVFLGSVIIGVAIAILRR